MDVLKHLKPKFLVKDLSQAFKSISLKQFKEFGLIIMF